MPSGRFTRVAAFTVLVILCVSAGVWLAPRVRSGPGTSGPAVPQPTLDAYRGEPGTALLHVLPPPGASSDAMDAAWQRLITTHAARIARAEVFAQVVGDPGGAAAKTRWHAPRGSAQHAGAVQGLMRATSVRIIPGTSLIAVRVDVEPRADAAALTEEIGFTYIKMSKDADNRAARDRVMLLGRELAITKIELDDEISKAILDKEKSLGADAVETSTEFSGKQAHLKRLFEERTRLGLLFVEQQSRQKALAKDRSDGKQSPDVRRQVREHPEYIRAMERLAEAEAEVEAAKAASPLDAKAVAAREKQRDARRARRDALREDLAADLAEIERDQAEDRVAELAAQAVYVDRALDRAGQELGDLNQKLNEYRVLRQRERELREHMAALNKQMTHINQFEINAPFGPVEWAQKATAGQ